VDGAQGVTGLALGATGIAGPTGILGIQGVTGIQGDIGYSGVTGLQGTQGDTGVAGVTGLQGIVGNSGVTGLQGTQGSTGVSGVTGLQGIVGNSGVTGLQGGTGIAGQTGIQGVGQTGIAGVTGITGQTGIKGLQNFTQFDSTQYPSFVPAELGWSTVDEALYLGITGLNWIQLGVGFKSMQGTTGLQGLTGMALGATGIAGPTGISGVTGIQGRTGIAGLTNRPREGTVTSSSTPTPDSNAVDIYTVTALATTATFGAPTGSPVAGQTLMIRIYDNGSPQTLAWNAIYTVVGVSLPVATSPTKYTYVGLVYNSQASTWDVLAVGQQ
jgi:hypothetical protein